MNPAVKHVALLVRDLMGYDEQLIRIGRQNFERADFETAYVVVDELGQAARVGNMETFDGAAEELSIGAMWRGPVTLDFYGAGAYTRAIEFSLRAKSQAAYELKRSLGINTYHASGPTDLKALTGQQYGERVQLDMVVEVSSDVTIDTLRIDIAQIQLQTETEEVLFDG
jgi:hypothetical protein